jgi:hypothetical protein
MFIFLIDLYLYTASKCSFIQLVGLAGYRVSLLPTQGACGMNSFAMLYIKPSRLSISASNEAEQAKEGLGLAHSSLHVFLLLCYILSLASENETIREMERKDDMCLSVYFD